MFSPIFECLNACLIVGFVQVTFVHFNSLSKRQINLGQVKLIIDIICGI